ncbi:hypothetical protein F383_13413 [Gossypium arboreum]|uniref:Uncharacterized protein n=1 Tax=Gossypium arboreum TaxID=29729 RepID=A0A0B0Q0A9_GOSAR|nr:hypothetical protein F383_13413 [Gossypium arboreum]
MTWGYVKASIRPCLGHGIGIEMRASVRRVWDMHQPHHDSSCKTTSGTWHQHRVCYFTRGSLEVRDIDHTISCNTRLCKLGSKMAWKIA